MLVRFGCCLLFRHPLRGGGAGHEGFGCGQSFAWEACSRRKFDTKHVANLTQMSKHATNSLHLTPFDHKFSNCWEIKWIMMSYDLYKLWLTDLSPALTAWIWLLTCQHWDLETQHLEPDSHVPSHRRWVTRVTFLECYSMPLSWVVFNISRSEHFSDFWFKALANWFIAPCAHPAVFCSPGSDWTSQSVVSHDSGHNSVLGPDAHLCFMKVRDHPEQQERSHGRRGSSALCEEGGHGHGHTAAPKRLLLYTGSKQTSIGF